MAEQHNGEYEAYLQRLSEGNLTNGVIYEPRGYFDMLPLTTAPRDVFSNQEVFRNGENFPVVITHMTAAMSELDQDGQTTNDERAIQSVGMYMKFHDQYYMNPPQTFNVTVGGAQAGLRISAPLPTWVNRQIATSDVVSRGSSSWTFPRPFILSVRDTLRVAVMTPYTVNGTRRVSVSFTGIGAISRQSYFLNGTAELTNNSEVQIDTEQFLNDGAEPILMTNMALVVLPDSETPNQIPDARGVFLRIRQVGNGTSSDWFQGPLNFRVPGVGVPLPSSVMGGINLGENTGRAVVHEFPKPVIWEPGEGLDVAVQSIDVDNGRADNMSVQIALLGYIAVQ